VLAYPTGETKSGYRFRIALASVAPIPYESLKAEAVLAEKAVTAETIAEAGVAAMDSVSPIDDVRGSARYRKFMVRNLTREAVAEVWKKISK